MNKTTCLLVLGLLAVVAVGRSEGSGLQPGWIRGRELVGPASIGEMESQSDLAENASSLALPSQTVSDFAAAPTPDIAALARGLKNDPKRIYDYVHDHIRYEHYFGSKKGAQLTLLEKGGNDFDQAALLVSLLRCAGQTNLSYQFGTVMMPYDSTNHQDFKHWVGATMMNNKWNDTNDTFNSTIWFISTLNYRRGFPTTLQVNNDTNRFIFHHLWVQLTLGGTSYLLDPSFKVSEPISGINLDVAMGLDTNALMSAASTGSSGSADYVQNLNETGVRGKLRDFTTNLLAYLQGNAPNASVEEILGGQRIVSSADQPLGATLPYEIYASGGGSTAIQWSSIPTDYMSVLWLDFDTTSQMFYLPELQGERLSLTYNSSGLAQLWLGDEEVLSEDSAGSTTETVYLSVDHPHGYWYYPYNTFFSDGHNDDDYQAAVYQRTNANYNLMYAFDPSPDWLRKRQGQLDAYRAQGLGDNSREVLTETLNIIGLNWFVQTDLMDRLLSVQGNVMKLNHHRMGRMGQATGHGYFVDAYLQRGSSESADGINDADEDRAGQILDLNGYFASAAEHGLIEQMESTNLPAASTVKLLQLGNASSLKTFLAGSNNWSTVSPQLTNYNTSALNSLINQGIHILLPQDGAIALAGAGSWKGAGTVQLLVTPDFRYGRFDISGGFSGGYNAFPNIYVDPAFIAQLDLLQSLYFYPGSPFLWSPIAGDPVRMVDGSLQICSTDLALGQREPRGISLTRYYSPARRYHNQAGLGNGWTHSYNFDLAEVSAPLPGLGTTTPAQMASMLAATRTALALYQVQPDPKNWLTTALIAKWGVDQLINNGVSITLGNDDLQFVKQPDGSLTPPAACTLTLAKSGAAYTLQERHGDAFNFNTNNVLTSITDPYGNSLTLAYSNSLVRTATDWKGRSLTFNYSSGILSSVSDSAGRSVDYGHDGGDLISVTDPEQKTTSYEYDTNHQISAILDALNQLVVTNFYDGFGRVITQRTRGDTNQTWQYFWSGFANVMQDPAGAQQTFIFDDKSRATRQQDALGNITQTAYDGQSHVVMTISPMNETNRFIYDGNNNLIYSFDPLGFTNQFVYDNQNNLTRSVDPRGNPSTFGYNAQFSVTGQTNGAGDYVNYSFNSDGTLHTLTDSGGTTTYDTYDGYGQLTHITYANSLGSETFVNNPLGDPTSHTDARGFVTAFNYNNRRQLTNSIAPASLTVAVSFDAVGNVAGTTDARGNTTSNTWSATRHLIKTTLPTTPQGVPVITNAYDNRDWLTRTVDPLQNPTLYTNDAAGRLIALTDPVQRTTKLSYDADGRRTAATNAAQEVTRQTWDARGSLLKLTDGAGHFSTRAYDAVGNQINLTNRNGKKWQFQFDGANRLAMTITPLGNSNSLTFNHQGLIATVKDQASQPTSLYYDAKERLTNRTDNLGTTFYNHDANGNLTSVTEGGNTNSWTYDAYNRASSYRDVFGNLIQYRYDASGNVTNLIYPGGKNVYYAFDSLNRMTNVTDWSGRKTSVAYDLASHTTNIKRPNGSYRTIGYDAAGQETNIMEQMSNSLPIAIFRLNWDAAARPQWEFAAPLPHTASVPSRTMTYDDDNRLLTFQSGTSSTLTVGSDADGNLTNAPLTSGTLTNYVYDARNRLLNSGGVTNAYDAINNRIGTISGTNSTVLVLNPNAKLPQVLMRIKNGVTNYYIYGAGLLYQITETATATNTLTYHYDYRGSTIALSADSGLVTDRIEYSAYGLTTYRTGTNDTSFLFNGRYGVQTDPNGLLYMRARYYNPYLCRFLNVDPTGFSGGMNFYAYANGNPVSLIDPFGLSAWTSGMGGLRAIGGGLEAGAGYALAVASGTAAVGTSPTVFGAVGFGALAVGGAAVGAHGVDTLQAGVQQFWTGNHVDSITSQNLQNYGGMSQNAANLTDAGFSIVGSLGAGLATGPIQASTIAATDPLAQGLSNSQILGQWENGSVALNNADFWALGGGFTSPLYKAALLNQGVNLSGDAYQLTTTGLQGFLQSIRLAPTGLTPAAAWGAGIIGAGLGAANGLGNAFQSSSTGK